MQAKTGHPQGKANCIYQTSTWNTRATIEKNQSND